MTRLDALRALEQKVAAGEWFPGLAQLSFGGVQNYYIALDAFNGSLDAAKALHEAVLPGWDIQITTYEDDSFEASVAHPLRVKTYDGVNSSMARAWLIAIIRALIAEGEG